MRGIIFVRHAESDMNERGIHQGQLYDGELSPKGVEQAKRLGSKLKSKNIRKIYSSDLKRAFQTAQIISKSLGNLEIVLDRRLREFTMGDFDKDYEKRDKLFNEFYQIELAKGKSKYEIRPPNGENIWDFIDRIKSFIKSLEDEKGIVLVVAHGGTNEVFINLLNGLDKYSFRRYHQDNACINEAINIDDKWVIKSINESSHLINPLKPDKEVYQNQLKIKKDVKEKVKEILEQINFSKAYIFGSLAESKFGKYSKVYGRHKGSNINILIISNKLDVPKEWKYVGKEEGLWEIYECGKYKIEELKHKIDFFIISEDKELNARDKLIQIGSKLEEIK